MFDCDICGECCRHLDILAHIPDIAQLDRGDGICRHLSGDRCSIYADRPLLCRVDEGFEKLFSSTMSNEEYYSICSSACDELKSRKGM